MIDKKIIFCFTFAGGTAGFYDKMESVMPRNVELVRYEYPGHGSRYKEPLCQCMDEVINDLYPQIKDYICKNGIVDYYLMGYSMGSITAFAMIQKIEHCNEIVKPKFIFLAAHEPMTRIKIHGVDENLTDEFVRERTIDFGGIPKQLIDNKSFWRMYLPIYKADYMMIERYRFEDIHYNTKIPVIIFYSDQDTKFENIYKWKLYFVGSCEFVEYSGSHFFINDYYKDMAEQVCRRMEQN